MSFATYEVLKNAVLNADIQGLEKCLDRYDDRDRYALILRMINDDIPPLLIYTVKTYLLIKKKSYEAYEPLYFLSVNHLRAFDGNSIAAHYLRAMRGSEIRILKILLSFNEFPQRIVRKKEAIQLARQILSYSADDLQAQTKLDQFNLESNWYKNIETMKLALVKADLRELHRFVSGYYSKDTFGVLLELSESVSEIAVYTYFASRLIKKPNNVLLYRQASSYLNFQLLFVDAYSIAVHYDRRRLALDPSNIDNKISLALYATMPDRLVKKKEAIKLAKDIIKVRPKNHTAISILYGHKYAYDLLVNKQLED